MQNMLDDLRRDSSQNQRSTRRNRLNLLGIDGDAQIDVKHSKVNRSLEFIARNYSQPFNLGKLVEVAQMSRRGFLKAFLKHTGTRPGEALRHIRIEQSKRLLIESDMQLTEIAALSGFTRLNSFCVAFRRVTGVAPKKFQRQAWLKSFKTNLISQRNGTVRKVAKPRVDMLRRL